MMDVCPVCDRAGLQGSPLTCPQCNADLDCFRLLEALQEGEAVERPVRSARSIRNLMVMGLLAMLVLVGWLGLDNWQLRAQRDAARRMVATVARDKTATGAENDPTARRWMVLEQGIYVTIGPPATPSDGAEKVHSDKGSGR